MAGDSNALADRVAPAFGAGLIRSVLPVLVEHGLADENELALDTFDERYVDEIARQSSVVQWIPFVGAWARRRHQ